MSKAVAPRKLKKGDHVFLIDGSSFIFRAYFAMFKAAQSRGRSFTRSDGVPTGAVLTFCNMLWKLLREGLNGVMPTHVAVVFDYSGTSFRNQIYSDYKGHRPDPPDELVPQFPLMRDAVRAFGLIPIEQEGFEADDLIATYARVTLKAGADVSIIAGDKDLMQLVRPGVMMFDPMPGNERRIGAAEVAEKFGVPPEKVPDVQALIGDTTDNVPGVPGIGVKTAAQLIGEYGDLETLLARAGEIRQEKRRQALIDNAERARLSKKLVTLDAHVALEVPLAELAVHEPDYKRLIAFLKAMEFATLTRRVAEFSGVDAGEIEPDGKLKAPGGFPPAREGGERRADTGAQAQQASLPLPPVPASGREAKPALERAAAPPTQGEFTPQALAAARIAAARYTKIDRSRYEIVRSPERLAAWSARARELGAVAIDTQTTSLDPMQAALCGFSLALAANESCYFPSSHHKRGDGGDGSLLAN